jgi:GNAT superfamily N-acetyltransferase
MRSRTEGNAVRDPYGRPGVPPSRGTEVIGAAVNEIIFVDGVALRVRPIQITDVERLERLFERLSPRSVYLRFFSPIVQLPRSTLLRLADVDRCRRDALVALDVDEIVAVARYDSLSRQHRSSPRAAEVAVVVEDDWQRRGLGGQLVCSVAALAFERGHDELVARILVENRAALALTHKLVPDARVQFTGGDYEARLPLPFACARDSRSQELRSAS